MESGPNTESYVKVRPATETVLSVPEDTTAEGLPSDPGVSGRILTPTLTRHGSFCCCCCCWDGDGWDRGLRGSG